VAQAPAVPAADPVVAAAPAVAATTTTAVLFTAVIITAAAAVKGAHYDEDAATFINARGFDIRAAAFRAVEWASGEARWGSL
jgi:hypothetical protein